jgi:hypothetical protein
MPKYDMPIPTRQEWQKLRDTNKVPKGAAKVSIGSAIEKVHKTFGLSSVSKNQAATAQLIQDVDAYLVTIKKKYPAFEPIVTRQVRNKAVAHQRYADDLVKATTEFYPRYRAVQDTYTKVTLRGQGTPKDVANAMERLLGCVAAFATVEPSSWEVKRKGFNRVMSEFGRADVLTQGHKTQFEKIMNEIKP